MSVYYWNIKPQVLRLESQKLSTLYLNALNERVITVNINFKINYTLEKEYGTECWSTLLV